MFQKLLHFQRVFRNILKCNYYKLFGKLEYPSFILPKENYKPLIELDELIESQHVSLIRRSDKSFDGTFNKLGDFYILKEDIITRSEVPNLSLNLLGGLFKEQYIKYKPLLSSPGGKRWDGRTPVYLANHRKDYVVVENWTSIYFDANNIHGVTVPYEKTVDKELSNLLKSLNKDLKISNNKYKLEGRTRVVHDPTNLNYWHVEFKLLDFEGNEVNYKKPAWIKEYCSSVLSDVVAINAFPEAPSSESIPRKFYVK